MLREPKRLLHIAPESFLKNLFLKNRSLEYISADLNMSHAMLKMDITDIKFPDDSFDVIMCNHVLEHVPDDHKAMTEFCRVLRDDGFAVLQVPIFAETTFEDPSVVDPAERLRLFGLEDHVRKYGRDYKQRLEKAGFIVKIFEVRELYEPDQIIYYGLNEVEAIYLCFKTERGFENISSLHAGSYH